MIGSINNFALSAYTTMCALSASSVSSVSTAEAGLNPSVNSAEPSVDFSNMTPNELRSWADEQFKNGKITIDELGIFGAMTLAIPVNGNQMQDGVAMNTKMDFVGKSLAGLDGAYSRNDQASAKMLQSALNIMRRNQNGIDCVA